jgi:hypothetical protein
MYYFFISRIPFLFFISPQVRARRHWPRTGSGELGQSGRCCELGQGGSGRSMPHRDLDLDLAMVGIGGGRLGITGGAYLHRERKKTGD